LSERAHQHDATPAIVEQALPRSSD